MYLLPALLTSLTLLPQGPSITKGRGEVRVSWTQQDIENSALRTPANQSQLPHFMKLCDFSQIIDFTVLTFPFSSYLEALCDWALGWSGSI